MAFVQKLDAESLKFFNEVCQRTFSEQAVFVLNAFYEELKDNLDFIYEVAWESIKKVDMDHRNIKYIHLYEEGCDLDFDMALRLFEVIFKYCEEPKNASYVSRFPASVPKDLTAITRKKEIRDTVDVNFDGRVSFVEYILYQYNLSPKDLMDRSTKVEIKNEALEKAMSALAEVNKKIQEYEAEKARLEELSQQPGVKGLTAKNQLAQLHSSPLAETLRRLLITAEAAVRLASKTAGVPVPGGGAAPRIDGQVWWLNKEVETKKKKYGAK